MILSCDSTVVRNKCSELTNCKGSLREWGEVLCYIRGKKTPPDTQNVQILAIQILKYMQTQALMSELHRCICASNKNSPRTNVNKKNLGKSPYTRLGMIRFHCPAYNTLECGGHRNVDGIHRYETSYNYSVISIY